MGVRDQYRGESDCFPTPSIRPRINNHWRIRELGFLVLNQGTYKSVRMHFIFKCMVILDHCGVENSAYVHSYV